MIELWGNGRLLPRLPSFLVQARVARQGSLGRTQVSQIAPRYRAQVAKHYREFASTGRRMQLGKLLIILRTLMQRFLPDEDAGPERGPRDESCIFSSIEPHAATLSSSWKFTIGFLRSVRGDDGA